MNLVIMDYSLFEEVKNNIEKLIISNDLESAYQLIEQCFNLKTRDPELYSQKSIIKIIENQYEEAEEIIKEGLLLDCKNFDLMFNLAYIYECQKKFFEALLLYRKILRINYYEVDRIVIQEKINSIKKKINFLSPNSMESIVSSVDNIMFIVLESNYEYINRIASILNKYGINVDIVYVVDKDYKILNKKNNPYRKHLGCMNVEEIIDYIKNYNYDIIELFNSNSQSEMYLEEEENNKNGNSGELSEDKILKYYLTKKTKAKRKQTYKDDGNFTILLPVYNRCDTFKKVISSLSNYQYIKPKVIVLDSSELNKKKQNKQAILNVKEKIQIEYFEFSTKISYGDKLSKGLEKVKTDFFAISPDDDFFAEEGLIESLKILKSRNDVFSVKGKNLYFIDVPDKLIEYELFNSLDQNTAKERLERYTSGYASVLSYQVFRTTGFIKFMEFYENGYFKNQVFEEYSNYFRLIITGKIIKINLDLNIRNKGIEREYDVESLEEAINKGIFNDEYKKMLYIIKKYSQSIGVELEILEIEKIFFRFLKNFLMIPQEYIMIKEHEFDLDKLKIGMKQTWWVKK